MNAQTVSQFLRDRWTAAPAMSARVLDRRARAAWDNVCGATGARPRQVQRISRTYLLCRDLQAAVAEGAGETVDEVIRVLTDTVADARRVRMAR